MPGRRRSAGRSSPVVKAGVDRLVLRDRPDLEIERWADGVGFSVGGAACEVVVREVFRRVGNLGETTDDRGRVPCGTRVQRDLVTALLFDRPEKLHVEVLPREGLRISGRHRSQGQIHNTAIWGEASLAITWDPGRRRVDVEVEHSIDDST